MAGSF